MDVGTDGADIHGIHGAVPAEPDADLTELASQLESADDLPLNERLTLLREAEAAIARSLEGLDGL